MRVRIDLAELARRENEQTEWKQNVADIDDVVATLAAFANDLQNLGGGYVVCGATEERDEHGFPRLARTGLVSDRLRELEGRVMTRCRDRVFPPIAPLVEELPADSPHRRILVFVQPATGTAHSFRRGSEGAKHFVRLSRSTIEARNGLLRELLVRKSALEPWDRRACDGATVNDLDLLALRDALQRMGVFNQARGVEPLLVAGAQVSPFVPSLCLAEPLTGTVRPRNYTILLFGREPQRYIPGAFSIYSSYPGRDRVAPVARRIEIADTLINQARRLKELLDAETVTHFDKTDLETPNVEKYPRRALQEAMINALAHRDYELVDPTRLTSFADRIEVVSPGSLTLGMSLEDLRRRVVTPRWRNQALAWFLSRLQLAQAEGQGIVTIRNVMKAAGCPPPRFDASEVSVSCFLRAHPRSATVVKQGAVLASFLRTYRQRFAHAYESWNLAGVQDGGAGRPIEAKLAEMYVELRLGDSFEQTETDRGSGFPTEVLLAQTRPLAIRGGAGSGKTTWMRRTFRRLLEREDALPLMLVLRDLARRWSDPACVGVARSLDAFLDTEVANRIGSGWEGSVRKALAATAGPRPVLLVDGWDELGPLGEEMREKLLGLMTEHPRLLVVVTSRPYGTGHPSSGGGFEVLDIQPLSDADVADLAYRFFRHCYGADEVGARREAERFGSALAAARDAQALSRTALHLTMMLLLSRSGPLPDKRHLLYGACLEGLLAARPRQKEEEGAVLGREQWRPADIEERLKAAAALAAGLQEKSYRTQPRSPIVAHWEEMAELLPRGWKEGERYGFLAWLVGPAAVLTDRADGTLTFTHLSFQEYLTAWHFNATIEGAEARRRRFRSHVSDADWWETLLLWAALVQKQNTAFLEPVIDDLLRDPDAGLYLAGMMLADGLGADEQLDPWVAGLLAELEWCWPPALDFALRGWAASRQVDRRARVRRLLAAAAPDLRWHLWVRAELASREGGFGETFPPPRPGSLAAAVLVPAEPPTDGRWLAAGRVVTGVAPLWPAAGSCGLLSLWPSARRIAGQRAQVAVATGASREDASMILRNLALQGEGGPLGNFARGPARDLARHSARDLAREFARDLAREFARDPARDSARDLARDFARDLDLSEDAAWVRAFALLELSSVGRVAARSMLAYARDVPDTEELCLLSAACRLSLHPEADPCDFENALRRAACIDPVWPALARHLTRRSTDADRELLRDLAAHPEKREPPLRWGLQYLVRGDVLFEDGTEANLDELCAEAGVPPFPLLEEMPDEIVLPEPLER